MPVHLVMVISKQHSVRHGIAAAVAVFEMPPALRMVSMMAPATVGSRMTRMILVVVVIW